MDSTSHHETSLLIRIRKLYDAEITQLSATRRMAHPTTPFGMLQQYMRYIGYTWRNVFRSIVFLSLNPVDFVTVLAFAFGCSTILGLMLLMCALLKILPVKAISAACARIAKKFGLNLTNPLRNIFHSITQSQVDAADAALAKLPAAPTHKSERIFDIDVAKLLLQLAALMYERGTDPILDALAAKKTPPDEKTNDEKFYRGHIKDNNIRDFCRTFGLDYSPVSELNASDSAYAALFWNPKSSWIVVAFKGTSPAEYDEWVSDFSYDLVYAGDSLPGFSQGGFLQRIFPWDVSRSGGIRPWDTITTGINLVAKSLRQKNQDPGDKINLFFTGHSLGCAIASLAYARAILVEKDLGEHVIVRDGYIFAAPIVCDVASVKAFDAAINENYDMPKTLWRVTNMQDIVATGLPDFGDRKDSRFLSNSLLNFAHLGAEIRLRSKPIPSEIAGWPHITRGVPVVVTSTLPADLIGTVGNNQGIPPSNLRWEKLPFIGRIFQHATNFYWDQLQRVGLGQCQWVKDD